MAEESSAALSTRAAFALMADVLRSRPAMLFERIGGEVAFVVKGAKRPHWLVQLVGGEVRIVEGVAPKPRVTIGIERGALFQLVRGGLDVEAAFKERRLAVRGSIDALRCFVACFAVPEKLGAARTL
jgi:hypothetical protein